MMSSIAEGSCRGRGLDSANRATKRLRSDNGNDGRGEQKIELPPEVWAAVMEYVSFETILSCAATCRSMLHDSCKLLTKLRIDTSWQLNLAVASRFRDVRELHINSLLRLEIEDEGTDEEWTEVCVDFETKNRTVPYLAHFSKLERVFFGAKDREDNVLENFDVAHQHFWQGEEPYPNEGERESMFQFIDSISVGFQCGALPKSLKLSGLCCPDAVSQRGIRGLECETCSRAVRSFPLESVLSFECRGSSSSSALSGRPFGLDVCLERAKLESIIESRPGGHELLRSEERLLRLLGKARRYEIVANQSKPFYVVKYSKEQIDEIQRVIRYAELDVKNLSTQKVSDAIRSSFAIGDTSPLPTNQCYVSKMSIDHLKDKVGLGISREDVEGQLAEIAIHARQITWVLINGHILTLADEGTLPDEGDRKGEYYDIERDCLHLVGRFMEEVEANSPINQTILPAIADAIPSIVKYLDWRCQRFHPDAVATLKSILVTGTEDHINLIVEAGAISSFSRLLRSSKECVAIDSVTSLSIIVTAGKDEHIQKVADAEGIAKKLVYLIESRGCDGVVEKSLTVLTAIKQSLPLHHLVRFIQSTDGTSVLASCSAILLQMIEGDSPPIQKVIDSGVLPRLAKVIKTTDDCIIQTNLAQVMMTISKSNKQAAELWEELILFLVGLQDSPCGMTAEKATSTLHNIASVGTGRWVSWKEQPSLRWGEFDVKGELVDSDDESDVSVEEAEEIDEARLKLEVMQSVAANRRVQGNESGTKLDYSVLTTNKSPTLMGMSDFLLEKILHFVRVSEVTLLEGVCKRFCHISTRRNDFWERHPGTSAKTRNEARERHGLRLVRTYQKYSGTDSVILSVLSKTNRAEVFRTLCADLLSRMIHLNDGPAVHFKLRGDTIFYIVELMQAFMVEKLNQSLLMAIHSHRTTVQYEDLQISFKNKVHSILHSSSDQTLKQNGNIQDPENLDYSCSIPSASGNVWHWPGDDKCFDVLPPEAGRRITRILAYEAGINKMTNDAFLLAEAEMLHTMGTLLVDAFESSVDMSKSASFLEADVALVYRMPMNTGPMTLRSDADAIDDNTVGSSQASIDKVKIHDMFKVPPPPFRPGVSKEDPSTTIYTIVPGQIADAAEERNIGPSNVYGCGQDGWVASPEFTQEEEWKIEESYYYKPYYEDCSDCGSDSSDDEDVEDKEEFSYFYEQIEWDCKICTFLNKMPSRTTCEMCSAKRNYS